MSSKKKNIYAYLGKVILITLLIVLCIRCFLIEPFTVSSSQMENALFYEDRILIDKTAYGIRLPITVLSIPFTFDNLWGRKSYSSAIQLPYARLFTGQIGRNEIVLFNDPLDIDKPLDKRSLILNRCIALPGDTMLIQNGLPCLFGGDSTSEGQLPVKEIVEDVDYATSIVVPAKGKMINLDSKNIIIYERTIEQEQGSNASVRDGKLFMDGIEQDTYTFEDDYYWMLSDNPQNMQDSRTIGFIPFKHVIGKARFVWYNPDTSAHPNRSFKVIK